MSSRDHEERLENGLARRRLLLGAAGALSLPLARGAWGQAAKSASASGADLEALIKAAKGEGELTLYSATPDTQAKRIIDAFQAKYGLKVGLVRLAGVSLRQRYVAEAEAGNIAADVMFTAGGAEIFGEECIRKGWAESITQAGIPAMRSGEYPAKHGRGSTAVVQITPWLIGYNTEKLKGAEVPRDWKDVVNPRFKGQIIIPDPRASDAYIDIWTLVADTYGPSVLTQIRALGPRFASAGAAGIQSLGAGEGAVMFPTTSANIMTVKAMGGPVDMVTPDKTTGVEMQVMLSHRSKARHPNAARLFAHYVMSVEGNKVFNDEPAGVTMHDPSGLPRQYEAPKAGAISRRAEVLGLLGLA